MNVMSRLFRGLFVLAALLLALTSLSVDWLVELYAPTDQWGYYISLCEANHKNEQLSRQLAATIERIHAKEVVVQSCFKGEISLFEAAAQFRSLHEAPRPWLNPVQPRPDSDDGESWCRAVIDWAKTSSHRGLSESQAIALQERLETQLREEREQHGRVILPD